MQVCLKKKVGILVRIHDTIRDSGNVHPCVRVIVRARARVKLKYESDARRYQQCTRSCEGVSPWCWLWTLLLALNKNTLEAKMSACTVDE